MTFRELHEEARAITRALSHLAGRHDDVTLLVAATEYASQLELALEVLRDDFSHLECEPAPRDGVGR